MKVIDDFVEVKLVDSENFLKIAETLTRMGVASSHENTLYQSAHILHKRIDGVSKYFIVHFKQMYLLDGRNSTFSSDDQARLNTIIKMLCQWDLISLANPRQELIPFAPANKIYIIPYKEKKNWNLIQKYKIGVPKKFVNSTNESISPYDDFMGNEIEQNRQ